MILAHETSVTKEERASLPWLFHCAFPVYSAALEWMLWDSCGYGLRRKKQSICVLFQEKTRAQGRKMDLDTFGVSLRFVTVEGLRLVLFTDNLSGPRLHAQVPRLPGPGSSRKGQLCAEHRQC